MLIGLYVSHCPQAIPISNSITIPRLRGAGPRLGPAKPRRLLYVRQEPGQSRGMWGRRGHQGGFDGAAKAVAAALLLGGLAAGCTDKAAPEYVADQFVDAYFRRMDQQAARQFTALGATDMLDCELDLTRAVRGQGYTQEEATGQVACRRKTRATEASGFASTTRSHQARRQRRAPSRRRRAHQDSNRLESRPRRRQNSLTSGAEAPRGWGPNARTSCGGSRRTSRARSTVERRRAPGNCFFRGASKSRESSW